MIVLIWSTRSLRRAMELVWVTDMVHNRKKKIDRSIDDVVEMIDNDGRTVAKETHRM